MSEPSIINTPAACIKCGFITDSPTTGKTHDRCPCCGGKLITISQLTPGENVIVLAKRASWECSNDDGEWYGRKTTEEQIIKHFASLGTELATLRAKLEEKERECERLTAHNHDLATLQASIADFVNTEAREVGAVESPNYQAQNIKDCVSRIVDTLRSAHATLQEQHRQQSANEDTERLLQEVQDIQRLSWHCIPFYAYGDNEAACDMAHRCETIDSKCQEIISRLSAAPDQARREGA